MSDKGDKVAASLLVHDACKMTDNGRWEIYKWLRRNAELVLNHGGELSGAFRARYVYQEASVKNKKAKIKAKAAKVKDKLKGKKVKIVGALALLALLCAGCSSPASRANTQNLDECYVVINVYGGAKGGDAEAQPSYGDILTQNMVVENSGTESTDQTHTFTPNTPISVPVGLGGGESLGVLGTLVERIFGTKAAASVADAACVGDDCAETK